MKQTKYVLISVLLSVTVIITSFKYPDIENDKFKPWDIIPLIDSLYTLKPEDGFYYKQVDNFKKKYKKGKYGVLALDLKHATHYSWYATFDFLRFKDSAYAQKAFKELVLYYKQVHEPAGYDWEKIEKLTTKSGTTLVYGVFDKAGITYILKDNYIISHTRRCNYDYKIQNPREDYLVNKLYPGGKPDYYYFIRTCCGCPDSLSNELR